MDNGHIESRDFYDDNYYYENYDDSNTTENQFYIDETNGVMVFMGAIVILTCVYHVCLSCKVVMHAMRSRNKIKKITLHNEEEFINDECSICLDKFKKNNIVNRLPCRHIFHQNCLRDWLKDNDTCPLCRNII